MNATSHLRGHVVRNTGLGWFYADTREPVPVEGGRERPCVRCGKMPTPEGYDPCLGHIPGAVSACCGHGVHPPILKVGKA